MNSTKENMKNLLPLEQYQKWGLDYDNRKLLPKELWEIRHCDSKHLAVSIYECPEGTRFWEKVPIEDITITIKEN